MLPPLNAILQIGVSSLKAHQAAMATTGHNIANTNTEGYTRQRVDFAAERPLPVTPGQLGLGVTITDIRRVRDLFFDASARASLGQQARYETYSQNLTSLEVSLGSLEGGVNRDLTDFFNGFHDLSTAPEDLSVRNSVISRGVILSTSFHQAVSSIDLLTSSVDFTVNQIDDEVNTMIDQIVVLNKEIARAEVGTDNANDFRDQRDLLIDKLSGFMDVSVVEQANGMIDVSANGEDLVTGVTGFPVQVVVVAGHPEVQSSGGVSLTTSGGKLRGLADTYLQIDQTRASLDDLANTLITEVNALHTAGFDLNGVAAGDFFTGTDASDIDVDATLRGNPALLAAADASAPGNNQVALQIVALQDQNVFPSGTPTGTLSEGMRNIISQLGFETRDANSRFETFQLAATLATEQRQAVSGVNMDEELSNMIAYQRAYEAAARVVTIVDEAMDTIINRMGRVGL